MKLKLDTYTYVKTLVPGTEVELPEVTTYWFERGVRQAIRMIPVWTTWNKEQGKPEEIHAYHITRVKRSFENKIESYSISVRNIPELFNSESQNIIKSFLLDYFDKRTKAQFDADLDAAIRELKSHDVGVRKFKFLNYDGRRISK